jgi:hypothetical protein
VASSITAAEVNAGVASSLPVFSRFSLQATRDDLTHLLQRIGDAYVFREYTLHDFSHVERSLASLEWLVPDETRAAMTPADWLLTVLAVYFHDLGMLVTKDEYDARSRSSFPAFKEQVMTKLGKRNGYPTRLLQDLPDDELEVFLYEEFVRERHAERVSAWLIGDERRDLGVASDILRELQTIVKPLPDPFKRDLALICLSHHREDLYDLKKYKPNQRYGPGRMEVANVQYAALLLRASDLLDITSERTPSILFRIVSPSNPVSQREWAKQAMVRSVSAKVGLGRDFRPDPNAPKDTIEVFATFEEPDPYFGLTDYLRYAERQLQQCEAWSRHAAESTAVLHQFPWKAIDVSNVDVLGYDPTPFEFTIDQERVLELLTGHRLYDNTDVVLRELAQNAIDAVRIQHLIGATTEEGCGSEKVEISWSSEDSVLAITDNGSGMTYDVIRNHLLKVGSSRYQDDSFREEHPDFNPISRFGIGVLTAFMISDEVIITTSHPAETHVRQLLLRSAQGKYLVRLLERTSHEVPNLIRDHGTQVSLRIRDASKISSVLAIAKKWIVVPECEVVALVDDLTEVRIGQSSVESALRQELASLQESGVIRAPGESPHNLQVRSGSIDGVSVAYAVAWNDYFRQWEFAVPTSSSRLQASGVLGTCIEGVRVETMAPGFTDRRIVALANITGPGSPTTNVARSGLERDTALQDALRKIYAIYAQHVKNEILCMYNDRAMSMARAAHEADYLLAPILSDVESARTPDPVGQVIARDLLLEEICDIPLLLVDKLSGRQLISPRALAHENEFWTLDSPLFDAAHAFSKQVGSNSSLLDMLKTVTPDTIALPSETHLVSIPRSSELKWYIFDRREVTKLLLNRDEMRLDIQWTHRAKVPRWILPELQGEAMKGFLDLVRSLRDRSRSERDYHLLGVALDRRPGPDKVFIEQSDVEWGGVEHEIGMITKQDIFLKKDSYAAQVVRELLDYFGGHDSLAHGAALAVSLQAVIYRLKSNEVTRSSSDDRLKDMISTMSRQTPYPSETDQEIYTLVLGSPLVDLLSGTSDDERWIVFDWNDAQLRMTRKYY